MSDDLFDEIEYQNSYHMISRDGCGFCEKALTLFNLLNVPVQVSKVSTDEERVVFIREGHRTFPRVFKNGVLIGGYDDFVATISDFVGNE